MCIILMNYFLTNRQLSRLENKMCSDIAMILDILRTQLGPGHHVQSDTQESPPDGNLPPPPDYNQISEFDYDTISSPGSTGNDTAHLVYQERLVCKCIFSLLYLFFSLIHICHLGFQIHVKNIAV